MFTGIVERTGLVTTNRVTPVGRRLGIDIGDARWECGVGDSICVSGVCLTIAGLRDQVLEFDVIQETLARTTLGGKSSGHRVNLERSLRAGDRLDGHFVQGHVDGTAAVESVRTVGGEYVISLRPDAHLRPFLIPKGAVTVDGVSLTIAQLDGGLFSVALIPTTLERTTLGSLRPGESVNIESDMIVRAVIHHLAAFTGARGMTIDVLREAGFT
jgi:riboflavin synthase